MSHPVQASSTCPYNGHGFSHVHHARPVVHDSEDTREEAPDFNSFFKIKNLEHQIQEKDNVIRHLKDRVANVNDRSRVPYNAIDVTALVEQNDCYRVELEKVVQIILRYLDSGCSKLYLEEGMAPVRISSGIAPQSLKMLDHSSSSLGLHCQKTCEQISSNLISQMSQRRLLASLQAPFLKEKKGVRFSALYLQQKRNLLVLDHSHQQVSYFFHARSVVKWINVDQLVF
ncbi:hypothetical protein Tco_0905108 [Tanacetum coccineum]